MTHPLLVASTRLQLQARHQAAAAAASLACALPASAEAHASPSAASPAASGRPPAALPSPGAAPAAAPAAPPPPPPLPAGPLAAVLFLGRTEGVRSLYAGLASGCGSLALANALYFTLYALLRDAVLASRRRRARRAPAGSPPPSRPASLGGAAALPVAALAGALNVLATTPLWVVVTRLQAAGAAGVGGGAKRKLSPLAAARAVYAADGLRGFWRGTVPSLCLVANPVVQFAAYEALLARFVASRGPAAAPRPVPPLTGFALAAAAKLAATLVTYPYLVVKTKQQAGGGGGGGGSESGGGARGGGGGTFAELARTAREEGLAGL